MRLSPSNICSCKSSRELAENQYHLTANTAKTSSKFRCQPYLDCTELRIGCKYVLLFSTFIGLTYFRAKRHPRGHLKTPCLFPSLEPVKSRIVGKTLPWPVVEDWAVIVPESLASTTGNSNSLHGEIQSTTRARVGKPFFQHDRRATE
jgi:hypothetical protein